MRFEKNNGLFNKEARAFKLWYVINPLSLDVVSYASVLVAGVV